MESAAATVVVIDDHDLFREGLIALLKLDPRLLVIGQGGTSVAAANLSSTHRPDLLILDVEIPGDDATATIAAVREVSPGTRIVMLTMHKDAALMRELLLAGADAYLVKTIRGEKLASTLVDIASGAQDVVTVSMSRESMRRFQGLSPTAQGLTDRELEVLRLLSQARSNAQIGSALSITEGTVKRHVSNIFRKLGGAVSRMDAVQRAIEMGLISRLVRSPK